MGRTAHFQYFPFATVSFCIHAGLLAGREKKVKFCGNFAGILQEFSRPVMLKNDW